MGMLVHADGNDTTVHYAQRLEVCCWHIKFPSISLPAGSRSETVSFSVSYFFLSSSFYFFFLSSSSFLLSCPSTSSYYSNHYCYHYIGVMFGTAVVVLCYEYHCCTVVVIVIVIVILKLSPFHCCSYLVVVFVWFLCWCLCSNHCGFSLCYDSIRWIYWEALNVNFYFSWKLCTLFKTL